MMMMKKKVKDISFFHLSQTRLQRYEVRTRAFAHGKP